MGKKILALVLCVMMAISILSVSISATNSIFGNGFGSGSGKGYNWEDFFKPGGSTPDETPDETTEVKPDETPETKPEDTDKTETEDSKVEEEPEELYDETDAFYWDYEVISMPGVESVVAGVESVTVNGKSIEQSDGSVTVGDVVDGGSIVIKAKEGYLITSYRIVCGRKYGCTTVPQSAIVDFEGQKEVTVSVGKDDFEHISGEPPYYILISTILDFTDLYKHTVSYEWTGAPEEAALPADSGKYMAGETYVVDDTYKVGTVISVKDTYGNVTGTYTFSGWKLCGEVVTGEQKMGICDVVLTGEWTYEEVKLETYTITYVWDETAPTGEYEQDEPVDKTEYVLNQPYTVDTTYMKGETTVNKRNEDGDVIGTWTFAGWDKEDGKIAGDLTITGTWTYVQYPAKAEPVAAAYKVEHYLEQENGSYKLTETEFPLYGEIGETAEAEPNEYKGYVFNEKVSKTSGTVVKAEVNEKGEIVCLVLTLYYDLEEKEEEKTYTVTYLVDNKVYSEKEYEEGDVVKVKEKLNDKQFYEFKGWYYPDNITVKNGKFVMPDEDVVIVGYYKFDENFYIPVPSEKDGTIKITKKLKAPASYDGDTIFTFEVYKNGTDKDDLYAIVEVEAGESEVVKAEAGTYYIYEVDAEEKGYTLTSGCDAKNNKIRVEGGKTKTVIFTNVYTEKVELEKDDHFGYIIGYPDGTVRPENNITRAEIATIFFRMLTDESRDYYWSQENDFTDVAEDDWFNNAVSTLTNAGILSGYEDGSFRPNASITRAELVKIAVAFYGSDAAIEAEFNDTEGHWADMFINSAYGLGFINGYEDSTFRPDKAVTRAEAMKIINRTLGRYPVADGLDKDMLVWSDNLDEDAWYYADVQEATNSHEYVWVDEESEYWTDILPVRDWVALENAYSDAYDGK